MAEKKKKKEPELDWLGRPIRGARRSSSLARSFTGGKNRNYAWSEKRTREHAKKKKGKS